MSEAREGAHGKGTYGERQQRDLLGGVDIPKHRGRKSLGSRRGLFVSTQPRSHVSVIQEPISVEITSFFKGKDLPTDVWAPTGVAYYEKLDDIPTQSFRTRNEPIKIDSYEERSAVALQVCPPMEGEPADASFKIVGERGLYVRVILEEKEETIGGVKVKKPIIKWMHFNEEDAKPKEIRFT